MWPVLEQTQPIPHYEWLRAQARQEGEAMATAFAASQQAYLGGERAKAKELSNEGKMHKAAMERLDKEASEWIHQRRALHWGYCNYMLINLSCCTISEVNVNSVTGELDLHG
jgi:hypothetical protein